MSADRVQPALGRSFLAFFRHDTGRVRRVAQGDIQHFVGRRHFQVQGQFDAVAEPGDIIVGHVTPILAQMRRDPVSTRGGGGLGCAYRVRMRPAARITDCRHMIDIDAKPEVSFFHRFPLRSFTQHRTRRSGKTAVLRRTLLRSVRLCHFSNSASSGRHSNTAFTPARDRRN